MAKTTERLLGEVLELSTDDRGRLTSMRIRGMKCPWLQIDPNVPTGEVHYEHFGDKSRWRDGVHHEETGGPWESESDREKPFEAFVHESVMAMRHSFVTKRLAKNRDERAEVFEYACRHRLISPESNISNSELDVIVHAHGAALKGDAFVEYCAKLIEAGAVWRYADELLALVAAQSKTVRERAEAALALWLTSELGTLGESQLARFERRVENTKHPLMKALFARAVDAVASQSPAFADLAAGRAIVEGRPEAAIATLTERARHPNAAIHVLNNLCAALLEARDRDAARSLLERIRTRIAARGPASLEAMSKELEDEYFFLTHAVRLAWDEKRYEDALPDARRGYEIERAIQRLAEHEQPFGSTRVCPKEVAYSKGAWGLISVLTRAKHLDEAVAVAAEVLGNELQMRARLARNKIQAEGLLVAITCLFLDPQTDAMLERSRPHFATMRSLSPNPEASLAYSYACIFARYGEHDAALTWLAHAKKRGYDIATAAQDIDFRSLYEDARFKRAIKTLSPR